MLHVSRLLTFKGEGRIRGIDFLLKKSSRVYDGWISYTLSKSEQRFPVILNNAYIPAQNDRRHQLNWVNVFKYKNWEFSNTYIFTSGRPYTDFSLLEEASIDRREVVFEDRTSFLENYHRIDVAISYHFKIGRTKAAASLSVFNLFDHKNVKYQQYFFSLSDKDNNKDHIIGNEVQMLGRTPNLSIRVEF